MVPKNSMFNQAMACGLLFGCLSLGSAQAQMNHGTHGQLKIGGLNSNHMQAGEPTDWLLRFFDSHTHQQITDFDIMHGKLMHMIVVKDDLSELAHIHPKLSDTGDFSIRVNTQNEDPDNQDLPNTVLSAGRYFVFTEALPKDAEMMIMNHFELSAEGMDSQPKPLEIDLDMDQGEDFGAKYFKEDGSPGVEGDHYRVEFSVELFEWCNYYLPKFYFKILENREGDYLPAENLNEWLTMGGHAVLVGLDGEKLEDRTFYHLHSFSPIDEPALFTFPYDNHQEGLPDGEYKIWGQFKQAEQILSFSFGLRFKNPPSSVSIFRKTAC